MYQIVLTSEFIEDLQQQTGPGRREPAPEASCPAPECKVVAGRCVRPGLRGAFGALVLGAASRLIGAH